MVSLEAAGLIALPVLAFFLLRLRLMPYPDLNDPAMHTTFIVDPRDIFERYSDLFTPTARLREGARVGLLVPARLAYLAFGPLGGFVVFRYVLALVAIVPAYLLMRRIAGVAAGLTAALVVLTCPVILTAWGTDFPDSSSVSYLIGALACLAMPSARHAVRWGVAAVVLLTLAAWAFATSAVIGGCFVLVYLVLRWVRAREHLGRDAAIATGAALATTAVLAVASAALLGQLDFITPTLASLLFLSHPDQTATWHSSNPAWLPYETYLLVLPAIALSWPLSLTRPLRGVPTPHLVVGGGFVAALAVAALLQFAGSTQMLEEHYFSSLSWAAAMLTLSLVLAVAGRPLLEHPAWRWSLPAMVVAVALAYEAVPGVSTLASPAALVGVAIVAVLVAAAVLRFRAGRPGTLALLCAFDAALLLITVTPATTYSASDGVVASPAPQLSGALGGGDQGAVDIYQVTTQLPGFVGPAAYPGQRLMTWWPDAERPQIVEPIGIFHAYFTSIRPASVGGNPAPGETFGVLSPDDVTRLEQVRPALVLLMTLHQQDRFGDCLSALGPYQPRVLKTGALTSGAYTLHVELIELGTFSRAA